MKLLRLRKACMVWKPLKMCSNVLNQQLTYATWMRKGNEIKEIMTFTGLGDFGAKKIKEKSDFLSKLDI